MSSQRDPNAPEAGGTAVAIPRVPAGQPLPPPEPAEPGGTMVGFAPVAHAAAPLPPPDESGATVIGLRRLAIPTPGSLPKPPPPPGPAGNLGQRISPNFGSMAMPTPAGADPGGTVVGLGRVALPQPAPHEPADVGGTMVGMGRVVAPPPRFAPVEEPEAGGTVVGLGRVALPNHPPAFGAVEEPEAGGTVVGLGRVALPNHPPAFGAVEEPEAGGTVVGLGRVALPNHPPAFGAAEIPEAGGTVVGLGRVALPNQPASFGATEVPDAGGTMVSMPVAGLQAAPSRQTRPSGPPPAYEIIKHLGGGDLGQVFHARHRENGAEVALRIIRPDLAAVPGAIEAARDVVALAQGAQHTHLGLQFELDETASPTFVSEYVTGKLLLNIMQERGLAPTGAVIDLGVRLCSALAAAHAVGLAHGRVHAGNVVLEAKTGRWVLVDLGHGYVSQPLEPAHDLYALGALLYEMATGHTPFEQGDVAADPRTFVPSIPPTLAALLMRTLAADPALWFPSALELAQALSRARAQTPHPTT